MKALPGYLTKNEAANRLGIARRTLDRYIRKHKVPAFRFLGESTIYILEEDIKKLSAPIRKEN